MIDLGSRGIPRYAQLLTVAILVAIGINHIAFAIRDWPLGDMDVSRGSGHSPAPNLAQPSRNTW